MAEWLVQLKGHTFDLQYLSTAFDSPKWRVMEKEGGHYLQSSDFDVIIDAESVRLQALSLISYINGAAKVERGDYQPVEVDAVIRVDEDGTRHVSITLSDTLVLRSQCTAVVIKKDGATEPSQSPTYAESLLAVADQDAKVKESLRMLGSLEPTWANLHKVFEIIQSDIGGQMYKHGWVTKKEGNRFTQTANSALAIGDAARHPVDEKKYQPPQNPMSLSEARSLIRSLISKWVQSKRERATK